MSLKIIHCADLHLDSVFAELSPSASKMRREDLRSAFSKIVSMVKQKNADMLIISGDMFDSSDVLHQTVKFVKEKIAEIKDIPVYICAGNHDPKKANSCYETENFGKNVHIFGSSIEKIETQNYDIYGVSFSEPTVDGSFLDGFLADNPDKINIMVMHGDFASDVYNLITKSQMDKSGIDYFALGHIHKHEIIKTQESIAVYPGCPEGRGFDETGEKGIVFSEISKEEKNIEFIPISRRKYHQKEFCVTDFYGIEGMCKIINEEICENDLYKIVLTGEADFDIDTDVVKDNINAFFVKVKDETVPSLDLEKAAEEYTLKGLFIKKALSELENAENSEITELALKIGLDAIDGR